jgi:probable HAF family extracellular repeat protein
MNASGHVVGDYVETRPNPYKQRAFLYIGGHFVTFAYPAANVFATSAWGINAAGHIVGNYSSTLPGVGGPYLYINGLWAPLGYPSAMETHALGINDNGQIVGQWRDTPGQYTHGYLLKDGTYTSIDFPNSMFTSAFGINNSGHIVGHYIDKNTHQTHGYTLKNGVYTSFDFPTGVGSTEPRAINDKGQIVASYYKDGRHGFLYDPIGNTFTTIDAP